MAERYTRHMNDRREGRQLYTLPAYARIQPYILRRRSDAACFLSDSVEVTGVEKWLREKRAGGWANLGFLHLIIAAYVRTVSMRPGINRFVSGRRIYARNDIEVVLPVKRSASVTATETSIKVRFAPTDTVFDVYRKLTEATDEVRADISLSAPEKLANTLMRFPRVLLRMAMSIFRLMDYFDWLPRTWLDVSPFHGSVTMLDLGSFGVPPADPHLADFGNMPCAVSFGARRKVNEADGTASGVERHYVDLRIACDERIADSCIKEIRDQQKWLTETVGVTPEIYRFPGGSPTAGNKKQAIAAALAADGLGYVDWNCYTGDGLPGVLTTEKAYQNAVSSVGEQKIVVMLMHDYSAATLEALPDIIDTLKAKGYMMMPLFRESVMIRSA